MKYRLTYDHATEYVEAASPADAVLNRVGGAYSPLPRTVSVPDLPFTRSQGTPFRNRRFAFDDNQPLTFAPKELTT